MIASTNRDLGTEVVEGRFRADLYYRLFVLNIELPRLRDRPEDLLPLARHFLNQYAPAPMQLGRRAICQVMAHDWPGNVRELKNVMQRAAVLADGERIEELEIVELPHRLAADGNWPAIPLAEAERRTLEAALRQAEGNQAAAARILEVAPKTVGNMLRRQRVAA